MSPESSGSKRMKPTCKEPLSDLETPLRALDTQKTLSTLLGVKGSTRVQWEKECRGRRKIKANFKKLYFGLQISIFSSLTYSIYVAFIVQLVLVNLS